METMTRCWFFSHKWDRRYLFSPPVGAERRCGKCSGTQRYGHADDGSLAPFWDWKTERSGPPTNEEEITGGKT